MANLITNTTLVNTERKIVIKYSEIGVGTTAQIAGHIEWATSDTAAEVPITNVTSEYRNASGSTFDFSAWGGLTKEGATANGNIKLDVDGIGGSEGYAFILEMRKIF